jgi:hypothetical protein
LDFYLVILYYPKNRSVNEGFTVFEDLSKHKISEDYVYGIFLMRLQEVRAVVKW